jgi:hypothetical protein
MNDASTEKMAQAKRARDVTRSEMQRRLMDRKRDTEERGKRARICT